MDNKCLSSELQDNITYSESPLQVTPDSFYNNSI